MGRAVTMQGAGDKPQTLPELRQELKVEPGARSPDGSPTWTIIDSVQHSYIQIDQTAYHLLSRWRAGITYAELAETIERDFGDDVTVDDVEQFVGFLSSSSLTLEPRDGGWRHYAAKVEGRRQGWFAWLIHNYLFIRLPLVRPEATLKHFLPLVQPIYTRTFAYIVIAAGITGIYLVSRQWDTFFHTFQYFFSWQGAASYAVALIFIKSAHELGHAFTAARFGCRVPSMGICFLVMFPVLYTDVTDAWRLRDRRERFMIGAAGVAVELSIACFATLAWSFLPDGVLRSIAFSLATVGWVLSIAVNFNPLMRFDGYYLFSDFLGVDNLQNRAFEFGRWRMREILFGLDRPAPEALPRRTARILTFYAWAVWIYRLILFTGIALLVYHFAFKVLGIVLFAVEIIYFIARPIVSELIRWWHEGTSIAATQRSRASAMALAIAVLAACVPWSGTVSVPVVMETSELARVFPKHAGLVKEVLVKAGDTVTAGQPLLRLTSAEVEHQIDLTKRKLDLVKLRLARRGSDEEDRTTSLIIEQELRSLTATLKGFYEETADLTVSAPVSGRIAEFNSEIHPGRAISRSEFVALIEGGSGFVARGYISERSISRVGSGTMGRFIPESPDWPSMMVAVTNISAVGASSIEIPELASTYGGPIGVRPQRVPGQGVRSIPVDASYQATFAASFDSPPPNFSGRGVVVLYGTAESLVGRVFRRIAAVLVRESGF